MKKTVFTFLILAGLGYCSPSELKAVSPPTAVPAAAPTEGFVFDDATWVVKDLSTLAKNLHVSMKLPKDAQITVADDKAVFIKFNQSYSLFVGIDTRAGGQALKESMEMDKEDYVGSSSLYVSNKVIKENADGFIYTIQENDEEGKKHQPESHFYFYLPGKDGGPAVRFCDKKSFDAKSPDSAFTVAAAEKMYSIIKGSAKLK